MKNPFKRNKQLKTLRALTTQFAILDEFERRGILHYHRQSRPGAPGASASGSLLIEESLATLKLSEGAEGFKHFLEQVAQWQNFKLLQEAYETHRINVEAKAVRDARKLCPESPLSESDITRIRQNARAQMPELAPIAILGDNPQEFDLFIIRATAPSAAQATEANGQLLALGHYDGTKLEMALYEDIKHNLQNND